MNYKKTALLLFIIFITTAGLTTCTGSGKQVLRDIPRKKRIALMIINFKNSTLKSEASEYKPWEFGIPSMIMTDLETIGLFNIISRERLKDILKQQEFQSLGTVDEKGAVELGKIAAAKYLLSGSFMIMQGNLRLESKVFSVESGTMLGASSVTGKIDKFFDLEKELVIKMTSYLGSMLSSAEKAQLARNVETTSVNASLNNYAGEIALQKADSFKSKGDKNKAKQMIEKARTKFKAALKHDPGYERAKNNLANLTMAIPMTL